MAIALTDRDKTLKTFVYGVSDVASGAPVTADTVFEIGSLGKPFTVLPILQLHERGRIRLDAPVSDYLPWFEVQSAFEPIAVHHLLNHTSGIIRGTDIAPHGIYESWALRNFRTSSAPGEHFWYSNLGYKTLGFMLERLYDRGLPEIIDSRVLQPLGMTHTYPSISLEMRGETATGYTGAFDDRPEHRSHPVAPSAWAEYAAGDGAQASTVGDMAAYLRFLLNRGEGPTGRLISEETFDLMTARSVWTGWNYYGYGLVTYDIEGRPYIGHGGGNTGFRAALVVDMDVGLGCVLLLNRWGDTEPMVELAQRILSAVRNSLEGHALLMPVDADPAFVPNAAEYAGTFRSADRVLELSAKDDRLLLQYKGETLALERRTPDSFNVSHPDFETALVEFGRRRGKVVEAFYGGEWFTFGRLRRWNYPTEWDTFVGHYRAWNPELSNFRIAIRKDSLVLLNPWGNVEPLTPIEPGFFRVGEDEQSPETLRFSAIADGHALRADYSGCPYYRAATP